MLENIDEGLKKALVKCVQSINTETSKDVVNSINTNEMYISVGGANFKLQLVPNSETKSVVDIIKEEFREKINNKMKSIINTVNERLNEATTLVINAKAEFESKEYALRKQIENSVSMPEISYQDMKNGLSISKGSETNTIAWICQALYAPKFINDKPINPVYAKKIITPIRIVILTRGERVIKVSTLKLISGDEFDHYHQASPDCWGNWTIDSLKWKNSSDILAIAKKAEAILERINENSIARRNPSGLPTLNAIEKNLVSSPVAKSTNVREESVRLGTPNTTEDVWQVSF